MEIGLIYLSILMFFVFSWLFITLAIYFIPVIIAYVRKHKNLLPITIMTIFTGWTFFGWLASLLWALNSDTESEDDD